MLRLYKDSARSHRIVRTTDIFDLEMESLDLLEEDASDLCTSGFSLLQHTFKGSAREYIITLLKFLGFEYSDSLVLDPYRHTDEDRQRGIQLCRQMISCFPIHSGERTSPQDRWKEGPNKKFYMYRAWITMALKKCNMKLQKSPNGYFIFLTDQKYMEKIYEKHPEWKFYAPQALTHDDDD